MGQSERSGNHERLEISTGLKAVNCVNPVKTKLVTKTRELVLVEMA